MLLNHIIHIVLGIFVRNIFLWTIKDIIFCLVITSLIQGVDTVRFYLYCKNRLLAEHPDSIANGRFAAFQRSAVFKMSQLFILKILWYSGITMLTAAIARGYFSS
jgi:hypothetical protein